MKKANTFLSSKAVKSQEAGSYRLSTAGVKHPPRKYMGRGIKATAAVESWAFDGVSSQGLWLRGDSEGL